jgi:hypothetical protein
MLTRSQWWMTQSMRAVAQLALGKLASRPGLRRPLVRWLGARPRPFAHLLAHANGSANDLPQGVKKTRL